VPTAFEVLAEPRRREILDLLRGGELPVSDLVARMGMSQPAVSKHLRVLREAGFVTPRVDAQQRHYRLNGRPFEEVEAWIAHFRRFWETTLDDLETHLNREDDDARNG
jgi:DNA-binding transcriptional ArsR family regulator